MKSLCQGREECSIFADSSKLSILANNKSVEDKIACNKNLFVLRVTSACVDERILQPQFLFRPSRLTEQERIPLIETKDVRRVSINNSTNRNLVETIEAKPLEPKKSVITFHQNEVKAQKEDHYEVRIKFSNLFTDILGFRLSNPTLVSYHDFYWALHHSYSPY